MKTNFKIEGDKAQVVCKGSVAEISKLFDYLSGEFGKKEGNGDVLSIDNGETVS